MKNCLSSYWKPETADIDPLTETKMNKLVIDLYLESEC